MKRMRMASPSAAAKAAAAAVARRRGNASSSYSSSSSYSFLSLYGTGGAGARRGQPPALLSSFLRSAASSPSPAAPRCHAAVSTWRRRSHRGRAPWSLPPAAALASGAPPMGQQGGSSADPTREVSSQADAEYGASQIRVLEGLEAVRLRPGMYIGSTSQRGMHHLVYEVVDNAVDEAQAGHATDVWVHVRADGSVEVRDNGRGIPIERHAQTGKSSLETVLTVLHAGGKFGGEQSGYSVSGGLHGVGISVVNALSSSMEVRVRRGDGKEYAQSFSRGVAVSDIRISDATEHPAEGPDDEYGHVERGTIVSFVPDTEIFGDYMEHTRDKSEPRATGDFSKAAKPIDFDTILARIREIAFLNKGIVFHVRGPGDDAFTKIVYEGGLSEYVEYMTQDKSKVHDVISFSTSKNDLDIECAMVWCSESYSSTVIGYANSVRTVDGGTHVDGLKRGLSKVVNALVTKYRSKFPELKPDETISGEHIREGLVCILSVKLRGPEFEGQTKTKLGNQFVRKAVEDAVEDDVGYALESQAEVMGKIISQALAAKKAYDAAKKARELVRQKASLRSSALPSKLSDCTSKVPSEREIFIVEGDSAGGSAKMGRDRQFQAVLALKGKILNVERNHVDSTKIFKHQDLQNIILALGLSLKQNDDDYDISKLRYGKIIIATDADVDGAHIRTLLLTFFFRFQRKLFDMGKVYMCVPPLYKVSARVSGRDSGIETEYAIDDQHLEAIKEERAQRGQKIVSVQRFKGLGEMNPEQLWATTMNPETRILKRITIEDLAETERTINLLMSDAVASRRDLIEDEAEFYYDDEMTQVSL